ncbi:MAG: glycosyltransferase family 2 protein [Tidjanibacter sp.]|nr:glycosyltransferase family 2 protein [Tidjanibacter sp.]
MNNTPRTYSVIIPLYNKAGEVERAVHSALAQSLQPLEVVVVDDGSVDGGAEVVEAIGSPLVRIVRQENKGVCVARNRAMAEAQGTHLALLDADDEWLPDYLAEVDRLVAEWPECGLYATAFDVVSPTGVVAGHCPTTRGVVENYWQVSMHQYVTIPSTTVIPRAVIGHLGGFPEGMKMGEDQWLWIKIASHYKVCFAPTRSVRYSMVASNRSASTYTPEQTTHSLEELLPLVQSDAEQEFWRREFVAKCAIGKALTLTAKGDRDFGPRVVRNFGYTRHYRWGLWRLRVLLLLPRCVRGRVHQAYQWLSWRLAHKGL